MMEQVQSFIINCGEIIMNIFQEGNPQDIAQVLAAKDYRVALQQKIFQKYP